MVDDIERRLASAAEALREHEVIGRRSVELRRRADELIDHLVDLRARHASEQADVDRLEGLSLTRVLVSLRGARDDRLARERAEAYGGPLPGRRRGVRLAALRREQAAAHARLDDLADAPLLLCRDARREGTVSRGFCRPRRERLLALADERGRLTGELHEIAEAVQAARAAADDLALVRDGLRGASGWSTYDTFFGGGVLSSAMKHSRLDATAFAAARADRSLAVLRTELADLPNVVPTAPTLAVGNLTRFVDVWFDNIFTDLAVRGRIKQAEENVFRCLRMVDDVRTRLEQRTAATHDRLAAIATERGDLLTGPPIT